MSAQRSSTNCVDRVALLRRGQPQVGVEALLDRRVAADPAEDEDDRGQQRGAVEPLDHLGRGSGSRPAGRCRPGDRLRPRWPPALRRTTVAHPVAGPVVAGHPQQLGVDLLVAPSDAAWRRRRSANRSNSRRPTITCWNSGTGRRSSTIVAGLAAHGLQPLAELLGVGHGRRQRDQRHRLGQVDDHLLPDRAAVAVGEVVHLVHHDVAEAVAACGSRRTACCGAPRWSSRPPAPRR